jgi:3',5'-cyclic AMP phosphodiesterase CpdA
MADIKHHFPVEDADSFSPERAQTTFRILHFSDIHTGLKDFAPGYLLDKRFFGRLNQFTTRQRRLKLENLERFAGLQQRLNADFTVCTGDLTSIGSGAEFNHAIGLLENIRRNAGGRFLFVPGNHDAYIRGYAPMMQEAFRTLNGEVEEGERLPRTINAGPVQFIAINGARPCRIWQSTGQLSAAAWEKLGYILKQPLPAGCVTRIICCHFPLLDHTGRRLNWRTRLLDDRRLLQLLAGNPVGAMLTGHVHHPFLHHLAGSGIPAVGAGSLTIHNSCALVDVNTVTGQTSGHILRFN